MVRIAGLPVKSYRPAADFFHMTAPGLHLLVVEDDPDTASLIAETLRDHFGPHSVQHLASLEEVRTADISQLDAVLSDMNLPDGTGLDVLNHVLKHRPDLPVILVTGEGIMENAARAIQQGAYDYIVKAGDYLFTIPLMVEKNLAIYRTKQENSRLQEELTRTLKDLSRKNNQLESAVRQLETVAATDPLTGLANRRAFNQALVRAFAEATRHSQDLSCIMIDLDGFKLLNDTLGHQRGDELLQHVARVLENCCRASDVAGRFGGDEFVVLLPQTDEVTAAQVAQRIADEFAHVVETMLKDTPVAGRVTMSMGLASLSAGAAANPDALIAQTDHALYRAKQTGRARLVSYSGMKEITTSG